MKRLARFNVGIIGAGTVGSVLGRLLINKGHRVACVVSRTMTSARRAGRFLRCRNVTTSLDEIPAGINLLLITVPHDAIAGVASALAATDRLDFRKLWVCHASGMLTAAVLDPLAQRGSRVFSFHPLQTFPRSFHPRDILESARGIFYGVDGSPKAIAAAGRLARELDGQIIVIPPERREFYHAACVVASNHLTTLMWVLERMFHVLGTRGRKFSRVFESIMTTTLRNVTSTSPAKALSGPVARGGIDTVGGHLASIRKHLPEIMPYFIAMTAESVRLAKEKGSIDEACFEAMMDLVRENSQNQPQVNS